MTEPLSLFWFRNDLRLEDNTGLYQALRSGLPVLPVYIFSTDELEDPGPGTCRRLSFVYDRLLALQDRLVALGSSLMVLKGSPETVFARLAGQYPVAGVYINEAPDPAAARRDREVEQMLRTCGVPLLRFHDHLVFPPGAVLKPDGSPYTVFTPYSRRWKERYTAQPPESPDPEQYLHLLYHQPPLAIPAPEELGFKKQNYELPPSGLVPGILRQYHVTRDIPGLEGTTRLSVPLRFGTISAREAVRQAMAHLVLLDELIWREFFHMLLYCFPHTLTTSFRPAYDHIHWRNSEREFEAWCQGCTGYPMVDAGMRQLKETGWMHNRVRMITASFLCKHLLIDWRWGEAWFAEQLLDYDPALNVGNWQWVAGSGADAAPYFRIFNPLTQQQKFDRDGTYVQRWLPELGTPDYPKPIVAHEPARARCLETYRTALRTD